MCKIFCMLTPLTSSFARYPVSLFNLCTMLYFIFTVCKTARLTTTIFALKYVMCKIFVFGIYFISLCSYKAELISIFTMLTPRCAVYRIFSLETKYKTGLACLSWALVGYI